MILNIFHMHGFYWWSLCSTLALSLISSHNPTTWLPDSPSFTFSGAELRESRNSQQNKSVRERQESEVSWNFSSRFLFAGRTILLFRFGVACLFPTWSSSLLCFVAVMGFFFSPVSGKTGARRGRFSSEVCWRSTKTQSLQPQGPRYDKYKDWRVFF